MKNLLAAGINDVIGVISPPVSGDLYTNPDVNVGLAKIISTGIQLFFFFAGVSALVYMLLGAFDWMSSGGEKEKLQKAQNKIQSAVIGLLLVVVVIVIIAALEQFVLKGAFCIGLTCSINIPKMAP